MAQKDPNDLPSKAPGGLPIRELLVGPQPLHLSDDTRVARLLSGILQRHGRLVDELKRTAEEAEQRAAGIQEDARDFQGERGRLVEELEDARRARQDAERRATNAVERLAELEASSRRLADELDTLRGEERTHARITQDELETLRAALSAAQARLEDDAAKTAAADQRVAKAEEARERAQHGSAAFQKMVEEASARARTAERLAGEQAEHLEQAERVAVECTHRANEAERMVAALDRDLARALDARSGDAPNATGGNDVELARLREELTLARAEVDHAGPRLQAALHRAEQAEAERERVLHLSDTLRLEQLLERAERLWPAAPERVDDYEAWLAEAEGLVLMLDEHRTSLKALRRLEQALPAEIREAGWTMKPGAWEALREQLPDEDAAVRELAIAGPGQPGRAWTDIDQLWWQGTLARLVSGIERLIEPGRGLVLDIERRLVVARSIDADTRSGKPARKAWKKARAAIADVDRCPAYDGLELEPQLGLLPIGADPDSGLWEFCLPHTGSVPERDEAGRLTLDGDTALVLVLIPGGRARIGAQARAPGSPHHDPLAKHNESPVHEVQLAPYFLAKGTMTQGQWERLAGSNPSRYPPRTRLAGVSHSLAHPVENVSWDECRGMLARLGLVLPTEVQWEHAARAGTQGPWWTGTRRDSLVGAVNLADKAARRGGATWASIDDWPELDDGFGVHAPVDAGRKNAFGLHGSHGNVWEWCLDGLGDYAAATANGDGLRQVSGAQHRVFRGGGFRSTAAQARVSCRMGDTPHKRASDLGVRPARRVDGL